MHLDEITNWIDGAFGDSEQLTETSEGDALAQILGEESCQRFIRDQANRQIIRDYLTNAVVLGVIPEGGLAAFAPEIANEEGRALLALYMLMSAVEEAPDLPLGAGAVGQLKPLKPTQDSSPHIKLVPN